MQFGVLGPLEVRSSTGEVIPVGGPKARALLVLLALNAGRVVSVAQILDAQFVADGSDSANAVQAQVSRLRRSLGAQAIEFHAGGYRLAVDPAAVDAWRFAQDQATGRQLLAAGRPAQAIQVLREALELWRGPVASELSHSPAQVARLSELRLTAYEDLFEAELALPDGPSIAELSDLAAAHPLRERVTGLLMRALDAAGRRAEALETFDRTRRLLVEKLGTDPSPALAAVHRAILRAQRPEAPARRRPAAPLTRLVGRRPELDRLVALRSARLVTIVGPGGVGKTRLAVEAARTRGDEACFVDLAVIDTADRVPQAVLNALGLRDIGLMPDTTADPVTRLLTALAGNPALLVVDNCEHVIAAVASLARTLLDGCGELMILATGREPLGLTGETLLPLSPLTWPRDDVTVQQACDYPAVRLFSDRAAAVRPGFTVTSDNLAAVVDVCAAVDGLPLGIELAAARLRQYSVQQVARRLTEHGGFRVLNRGDRTAAARHRTLHAVVAWSWELLSEPERDLAAKLAVFTGGATQHAVERICGLDDAADLLADLVDKSFIITDGHRYRMLTTIHAFCAEHLDQTGDLNALRRAHAHYFLAFAGRAEPWLRRSEQLDWLAKLSDDHDNLMAALRWAATAEPATAMRMLATLAAYLWLSGRRGQVGDVAARLLVEPPPDLAEEYVSCVVHAVPRPNQQHWTRARRIMSGFGAPLRHPFGAAVWGMIAGPWAPTNPPDVERLLGDDPWNIALSDLGEAMLLLQGGRPGDGETALRDVLAAFRKLGERWGIAQSLDGLAQAASWRGEWNRATTLWTECLDLLGLLGATEEIIDVWCKVAESRIRQGDLSAAQAAVDSAVHRSTAAGRPHEPMPVRLLSGELARLRGDTKQARRLLEHAHAAVPAAAGFGTDGLRSRLLTALARLAAADNDPQTARQLHGEALVAARHSPLDSDLADAAQGQADAAMLSMSFHRAALLLGVAVALRGIAATGDPDVARLAAASSEHIGAEAFASEFARGAALQRDQALTVLTEPTG
jgi:predicted ATPase/DNA-binding SARP family transcriptional activator